MSESRSVGVWDGKASIRTLSFVLAATLEERYATLVIIDFSAGESILSAGASEASAGDGIERRSSEQIRQLDCLLL